MTTGATTNPDEDIITGPKDGDSLGADLDNRRVVTDEMLMGGHPNDGDEEEPPADKVIENPEVAATKGEAAANPLDVKEESSAGPRFKSQEEAEKAHAAAVQRMTDATTQAARDKEAREAAERERDDLRQQLADKAAEKPPDKPVEEVKPVSAEERKAKLKGVSKQFYAKVEALDRTEADYNEQVAEALAETLYEAGLGEGSVNAPNQAEIQKMVSKQVQEALEAASAAKTEADKQKAAEDEGTRLYNQAVEQAKAAGLDMGEDSADQILFDALVQRRLLSPEVMAKPYDDQVKWVIDGVRAKTGKIVETQAEREAAARRTQEDNAPLGRGGGNNKPRMIPKQETDGGLAGDFAAIRHKGILG